MDGVALFVMPTSATQVCSVLEVVITTSRIAQGHAISYPYHL
ncbi:hypothetical protein HCU01_26180 [Halomonas cupida]|uniref:Uncharacterized protein n=1 Tax=Halomonas cupida TaxID=44933 RepID=A0A1M7BX20_9GAMM|nr:hypothetical protein HCU01_26180 [Halomonas cupida]SHL59565.1 hypothetical protein SAMN05660971_00882 [Halomonas cupida]